jgi:hypothetical protein
MHNDDFLLRRNSLDDAIFAPPGNALPGQENNWSFTTTDYLDIPGFLVLESPE